MLSGVIAGIVAQHVAAGVLTKAPRPKGRPLDLYDAARIAVQAHALAGERWSHEHKATSGLLAAELGQYLPEVIETLRGQS